MSHVTGVPLLFIKIKLFSEAKSAVFAIFSILNVVESPKQISFWDEFKIGLKWKLWIKSELLTPEHLLPQHNKTYCVLTQHLNQLDL